MFWGASCYWFPTGFESTRGYWTDHLFNHKQLLQIVNDKLWNIQCYYMLTEYQPKFIWQDKNCIKQSKITLHYNIGNRLKISKKMCGKKATIMG